VTKLQNARIDWQHNTARSLQFDDVYFNTEGGQAEARHVFLDGNRLGERFSTLASPHFSIAETGFGTGLNFLCTRALWLRQAPASARLNYIAVEKYPLTPDDLARCLGHWPEFDAAARQLQAQYPPRVEGFHRLEFDAGRISLTMIFDDAVHGLSQLEGTVDAWFLDGFSPAKNPDLWSAPLFAQMARLSHQNSSLATFSTARSVRDGLTGAGFSLAKAAGFGAKREMLTGSYGGQPAGPSASPWFDRPKPRPRPDAVLILGAGLAGCSAAHALARRGIRVTLLDQASTLASGGSGNRQGALYAKLPVRPTKQGLLHSTGLGYSHHLLQLLERQGLLDARHWQACGLLQLAQSDKEIARQQQLLDAGDYPADLVHGVSAVQASALAGMPVPHRGLYFPTAGWVSPVHLCRALVQHPLIEVHTQIPVRTLVQCPDSLRWRLSTDSGDRLEASVVIVATAGAANSLAPLAQLPLKAIRGQVSEAPVPGEQPALKTVVCGDGYIAPPMEGTYCFGATFDLHDPDIQLRDADHGSNLATLSASLPVLGQALAQGSLHGRVAFRCSTPDYLPLVGPAPNRDRYLSDYARLSRDRKWSFDTEPTHHAGLYISVGHGSKGLLTCPIGAELLAAMICNEPLPLGRTLIEAMSPARFIIKNLIRGSI